MLRFCQFITFILIGLAATAGYGFSEPFLASPAGTLFADEEILNIELDAPLKHLFAYYDLVGPGKSDFNQGHLSYFDHQNKKITVPVRVFVKGYSSARNCPFKKLEIKFKESDTQNTIFAQMHSVDLNTHCSENTKLDDSDAFGDFAASFHNHREVLLYKMAKLLRIPTYQARAVFVRYTNTGLNVDTAIDAYQAFFVEDKGDLLKRIHAREIRMERDLPADNEPAKDTVAYLFKDIKSHPELASEDLYRSLLFNSLIRNFDWGVPIPDGDKLWNIKIIETQPGKWVPLVHDFSLAAPVATTENYPVDIENLNLVNAEEKSRIIASFKEKRAELYALIETMKHDKASYDVLKICLDAFFKEN